jgi:hypothetical protein
MLIQTRPPANLLPSKPATTPSTEETTPDPTDTVQISAGAQRSGLHELNGRLVADIALHLGANQAPSVLAMTANFCTLPPALGKALPVLNLLNTVTSAASVARDLQEVRQVYKNPDATRLDRFMDVNHLVAGDLMGLVGGIVPLIPGLAANQAAMAFSYGAQLLSIGLDVAKTGYDIHRARHPISHPQSLTRAGHPMG